MVDSTFARDDVIAFLASAPIRRNGDRPVPVDRWDLISRRAGVVDGDDWSIRLDRYATEMAERDRTAPRSSDDPAGRRRGARRAASRTRRGSSPTFVAELRARLADFAAAAGWRDRVERARAALRDALGDADVPPALAGGRSSDALDAVLEALDRLAALEAVEDAAGAGRLPRAVDAELAAPSGRRRTLRRGCALRADRRRDRSRPRRGRRRRARRGTAARVPRREDALLADGDRRLAVDGELARPRRRRSVTSDARYLAALGGRRTATASSARRVAICGPAASGCRRATCSRPRRRTTGASRSSAATSPSSTPADGLDAVPSFAAGIRRMRRRGERRSSTTSASSTPSPRAGGDAAAHPLVARHAGRDRASRPCAQPGVGRAHPLGRQRGRRSGDRVALARHR